MTAPISLQEIRNTQKLLSKHLEITPIWSRPHSSGTTFIFKLELFQRSGTFKARGALVNILSLNSEQKKRGVIAASAGNHAAAVSYAANVCGVAATVFIPKTADKTRVALCEKHGAKIIFTESINEAFTKAKELETKERLFFIHPFESDRVALGTATLGAEFMQQAPDCDAVIVPVGGGGLLAGIAAAIHFINPNCEVYGVEPEGANSMFLSFASNKPETIPQIKTIADSLGAPYALPYSFSLCKKFTKEIVLVSDDQITAAIYFLFREMRLAVEPACATATAGFLGPLNSRLKGKKVGIILCGTNIAADVYMPLLMRGEKEAKSRGW
jgi:threonine dehydratase